MTPCKSPINRACSQGSVAAVMMSRYDFRLVHGDIGKTSVVRFLTIIRHCAAENSTPDHDRPLSSVGRAQAEQLRSWVSDPQALGAYGPTTCLVSAAARTRETYALGLAGTPFVRSLEISESIYNGSRDVTANDLVEALHDIDPVTEPNDGVLRLSFDKVRRMARRLRANHFVSFAE